MDAISYPVNCYRSELREAHARHTSTCFEELRRRSGVDQAANARTIAALSETELALKESGQKSSILLAAGATAGVAGLFGAVAAFASAPWWAVVPVLSGWAILQKITPMFRAAQAQSKALQAECARHKAEAWAQMAPLNALYDWGIPAQLIQQTLPLLHLDPYFANGRLQDLRDNFGWDDRMNSEDRSITFTHSGTLGANPFVVAQSILHWMSVETYSGSLVISWQESYRDAQGNVQFRTHTQTLTASVIRPAPAYTKESFVLYGNEAAPDLSFAREPSSLSSATDGKFGRWRKGLAVKKLEAKARKLEGFTVMSNQEFDALFHAVDRDHEVQFRVLFTPLAQQEMLNVLKDKESGFGDDFSFYKWQMINAVLPEHLNRIDIGLAPAAFHHYDLEAARRHFNDYHNALFRSIYFSFAPLLSIPLYQEQRAAPDIGRDVLGWRPSYWEMESLINAMEESAFAHPASATKNILKVSAEYLDEGVEEVEVTAYGFRTLDRVHYVTMLGGDGNWHDVPVPWTEYIPVERTSMLLVFTCRGPQSESEADEPAWRTRMLARGVDPAEAAFHRALAGVLLS
jgi:hypothetical protein